MDGKTQLRVVIQNDKRSPIEIALESQGPTALGVALVAHAESMFGPLDVSRGDAIALAHQFAAAPEMLAALKEAQDMLHGALPHAPRIRDLITRTLGTVNAAIAKAEGR